MRTHSKTTNFKTQFFDKYVTRTSLQNKFSDISQRFLVLKQVHGNSVLVVESVADVEMWMKRPPEADAWISNLDDVILSVHTADCLPVLASGGDWFGACHAGWRGLSDGILEKFVMAFKNHGCAQSELSLEIGPSICEKHFEAHLDVIKQLAKSNPLGSECIHDHSDPLKKYFDLKHLARLQLSDCGIKSSQLIISDDCTYCLPEKYFSFRRDKIKGCLNEAVIYR